MNDFKEVIWLENISVTNARKDIYKLLDKVNEEHRELIITGKRCNAVLIGEEDWHAIQETLYLYGRKDLEDVREGIETPLEHCEDLPWKYTKSS